MGKSDDSIARRKNKRIRRKQDDSAKVSNRIATIIAAKKRRLSGKRRLCQGMCFSLPTPDDPFNDSHGKTDTTAKSKSKIKKKKKVLAQADIQGGKSAVNTKSVSGTQVRSHGIADFGDDLGSPSKFLIHCLDTIENVLREEMVLSCDEGRLCFDYTWGIEFWKCYSSGKDVVQTNGAGCTVQQIAWMASCAADSLAAKEKEGRTVEGPSLLFLVPSQEKASEVRHVCKPLKSLGVHTVSLHPGASIDHQIQGLKRCEPEFLVSTPERLLKLATLNALDLTGVSLLVIDGLEKFSGGGNLDAVISVRQLIRGSPQTVIFSDCPSHTSAPVMQKLLQPLASELPLSIPMNHATTT